ncbi:unnamed protein product [Cylicocyclus nassatus]|uniref:Uncharacterized protein n=1 Tax=Cylicocyclus nassatus TaxID=53992 RepID=A0AA36GTX3_CYLNA|nr:unnamed protein product [Cylicocyclus nassatus]
MQVLMTMSLQHFHHGSHRKLRKQRQFQENPIAHGEAERESDNRKPKTTYRTRSYLNTARKMGRSLNNTGNMATEPFSGSICDQYQQQVCAAFFDA